MTAHSSHADPTGKQELSSPAPYDGMPPRLSVCLTEYPMGTPRAHPDSKEPSRLPPDATVPSADWIAPVQQVVNWCCFVLQYFPLSTVWQCPAGRPEYKPNDPEEQWAKTVSEMFLGLAYGGPDMAAAFKDQITGKNAGSGAIYIYQRIQQRYLPINTSVGAYLKARYQFKQDQNAALHPLPAAKDEKGREPTPYEFVTNTDPAYSIVVACQFLSTYCTLARGFTLEEHLNGYGLPAAQCAGIELFASPEPEKEQTWLGGYWYSVPGAQQTVQGARDAGQKIGPGTVYTFNPRGNLKTGQVSVTPAEYFRIMLTKDPAQRDAHFEMCHAKHIADTKEANKASAATVNAFIAKVATLGGGKPGRGVQVMRVKTTEVDTKATLEGKEDLHDQGMLIRVPAKLSVQHDGSHITSVLRVWEQQGGLPMVQLLDTSLHGGASIPLVAPMVSASDSGGIMDGSPLSQVSAGPGTLFVGTGTPPERSASQLSEMVSHLRKARPVGLARLVVTVHAVPDPKRSWVKDTLSDEHILLMSPLALMWGSGQVFQPARYALSLRNLPYYESLRAYWMLYAPRHELADVMWEQGARASSLVDICGHAAKRRHENWRVSKKYPTRDKQPAPAYNPSDVLFPAALFSSQMDGSCSQIWQGHCLKPLGRGSVPKILRELLISAPFLPIANAMKKPKQDFTSLETARKDARIAYLHPDLDPVYGEERVLFPEYLKPTPTPV